MWWLNKILKEKKRSCFPSLEVAFDPWIIYQWFSQNSIYLLWTVYAIISFRLLFSLLKRWLSLITPGVEMCKGHTSPLGATIARETWRTLQQRGGLTWWWPNTILFVSRCFFNKPDLDLWKISRGFSTTNLKEGLTVYGRWLLILYNLLCLLSLLGGRGLWLSIDWPDNVRRCSMWVHLDKVIAVITGNEQFAHDE